METVKKTGLTLDIKLIILNSSSFVRKKIIKYIQTVNEKL